MGGKSRAATYVGADRGYLLVATHAGRIKCYVQTCLGCLQDKVEQRQLGGLLELLPVAKRPWESMTMDFITSLPKFDGFGTIMVMVERFSKYATFMLFTAGFTAKKAARLFFKNLVKYWELSRHIISD